jgi:hypothetical protein
MKDGWLILPVIFVYLSLQCVAEWLHVRYLKRKGFLEEYRKGSDYVE